MFLGEVRIPRRIAACAHFVVINKGVRQFYLSSDTRKFINTIPILSYFEKKADMSVVWAYVSLWLGGLVSLDVCCRANKVEGTMSCRCNEPKRFWYLNMT